MYIGVKEFFKVWGVPDDITDKLIGMLPLSSVLTHYTVHKKGDGQLVTWSTRHRLFSTRWLYVGDRPARSVNFGYSQVDANQSPTNRNYILLTAKWRYA